jgi:hypothetical protein
MTPDPSDGRRVSAPGRVVVEVPQWVAAIGDRGIQAIILLVAAAAGGFVAIGLAWSGVAARLYVGLQLPFLVSGAFGGVAVAAAFLAIAGIQLERRYDATERFHTDLVVRDIAQLCDELPAVVARRPRSGERPAGRARPSGLVRNGETVHRAGCRVAAGKDLPAFEGSIDGEVKACKICRPRSPLTA